MTRLVNQTRWKGRPILSISSSDPNVPMGPDPSYNTGPNKKWVHEPLEKTLLKLLETRPVWTRTAICNHVTEEEARTINKFVSFAFWLDQGLLLTDLFEIAPRSSSLPSRGLSQMALSAI